MTQLRKWLLTALSVVVATTLWGGVGPARADREYSVLIVDNNTGAALHAKNADEPRYPASLTKMMTLYIVFEMIEQGRLSPNARLKISATAASASPSKLDLEPGEEIAVMDAVKALITKSANDIAVAVAENIAGSEPAFATIMTRKAHQLGMKNTQFRNASGLPDSEQMTTARDMVTLAQRLSDDFPNHFKLFAIKSFSYNGSTFRNHNNLLFNFAGTEGIKTGYISRSGFNLVTSVRRGNRHVIGAIFGGATAGARDAQMRMLLTSALAKASTTPRPARPVLMARAPALAPKLVRAPAEAAPAPPAPPARTAAASDPLGTLPWLKSEGGVKPSPATPAAVPVEIGKVKPAQAAPADAKSRNFNPPIEIASVRPIFVPPRKQARTAGDEPAAEIRDPGMPPSTAAAAQAPAREPKLAEARGKLESPVPQAPAARAPQQGPSRGLPPSTLQAQAEGLGKGAAVPQAPVQVASAAAPAATPAYRLRAQAVSTVSATAGEGGFQIQIGAFATIAEAERNLASAKLAAGKSLDGHAPVTFGVLKQNRQLFRARFAGFNQAGAQSACTVLRQQKIDCFVMKAE